MSHFSIGHTGITWGIPGDVEAAYRDVAQVGYRGFETFTRTIQSWNERPGGYRKLVDHFGIPTCAGYCFKEWIGASSAAEFEEAKREADALRELPGSAVLVLQAGPRLVNGYASSDFSRFADVLNRFGDYCKQIGLIVGLHPHTGTAIETRPEIETIMGLLDPTLVGLAPDTGQLAKGGCDVVEVFREHRDRIVHVHLKDWNGVGVQPDGTENDLSGYLNYAAVGDGVLPIVEILDVLSSGHEFCGWVNVELEGTERSPRHPREAAARSQRYLAALLGENHFAQRTL